MLGLCTTRAGSFGWKLGFAAYLIVAFRITCA